jgi:hypothetical protein
MKKLKYKLTSKVTPGSTNFSQLFSTLDKETSDEIRENFSKDKNTFGPVAVTASIRTTTWATSLIPDGASGIYLLPLKKEVREKEEIAVDDDISFTIQLKEPTEQVGMLSKKV